MPYPYVAPPFTAAIEVDPDLGNSADSSYASSGYDTSAGSLNNTVNDYVFENGRRYHVYFGADKNFLPTDEREQDRMDLHHEILLRLLNDELHTAPLKDPEYILDVGTGTGIWAIDMAERHPNATVLGIDLSPIQPSWVPQNCKFDVDDIEKPWTFPDDTFDFIHFRNLNQGISRWGVVLREAFRCLKPGGYVEIAETRVGMYSDDGTMADDNAAKVFCEKLAEALAITGRPVPKQGDLDNMLLTAGFVDITPRNVKHPWGPWPKEKRLKEVGMMMLLQGETAFSSYGMAAFTRILGYSTEEAQKFCDEAYASTKNKNCHMHSIHYIAYGRKPETDGEGTMDDCSEEQEMEYGG